MHSQQYEILRSTLEQNMEDWNLHLILADCCEESGNLPEAEFWRWKAKNQIRPMCMEWSERKRQYRLFDQHRYVTELKLTKKDPNSNVPRGVFQHMMVGHDFFRDFNSIREADDALFGAWKKHKTAKHVTKETAMTNGMFYHATARNRDGSAVRCRANGKCRTWKRDPGRYRLPVKYGLRQCFYITSENEKHWYLEDPTENKE